MSYRNRAIVSPQAFRHIGYGYGWRFSDARSVQAATSDRSCLGGKEGLRCLALCPTISES